MIVAGTGHRPNKLGGYSDQIYQKLVRFAREHLQEHSPSSVISGMALGWDMALAEAAIDLEIPLTAAIPCNGHGSNWPLATQNKYNGILEFAAEVKIVSPGPYENWKMMERNRWMVNNSDLLLALWDGSHGGTQNCLTYASMKNRKSINLWDKWQQYDGVKIQLRE